MAHATDTADDAPAPRSGQLPAARSAAAPPDSAPWGPPWIGPARHRTELDMQWLVVTAAMLGAALVFFGWRAMFSVAVASLSTLASYVLCGVVVRLIRGPDRGAARDSSLHALVLGLLLGLSLPVTHAPALLPMLGGILLGVLANFVGRSHRVRMHPVATVIALLWLLLVPWNRGAPLEPGGFEFVPGVLKPEHAVAGDVADTGPRRPGRTWWSTPAEPHQALGRVDPLLTMLRAREQMLATRPSPLVTLLSRGDLPRLGEVLIGAVPGPVGATSPVLMIVLGLWLMYCRQSRWSVPIVALLAALLTLALMPVRDDDSWTFVFLRLHALGPAVATTFLAYLLLAAPWPLLVLILAPLTAPLSSAGRVIYGLLIGSTGMALLWLLASPPAVMFSLVLAGALSRPLDALHRSPFVR